MDRSKKPFRETLAEEMRQRGLQQLELAVRSDVSEAAISLYLSGRRRPRITTIEKLARGLDLAPDHFVEWRAARAKVLIEEAMAKGLLDLEDIELILERRKAETAAGSR
jgi:transcriptional regulator with XRE-family HTH domain